MSRIVQGMIRKKRHTPSITPYIAPLALIRDPRRSEMLWRSIQVAVYFGCLHLLNSVRYRSTLNSALSACTARGRVDVWARTVIPKREEPSRFSGEEEAGAATARRQGRIEEGGRGMRSSPSYARGGGDQGKRHCEKRGPRKIHENGSRRADSPRSSASDNFSRLAPRPHHPFLGLVRSACSLTARFPLVRSPSSAQLRSAPLLILCGDPHSLTAHPFYLRPRALTGPPRQERFVRHLRGYMGARMEIFFDEKTEVSYSFFYLSSRDRSYYISSTFFRSGFCSRYNNTLE